MRAEVQLRYRDKYDFSMRYRMTMSLPFVPETMVKEMFGLAFILMEQEPILVSFLEYFKMDYEDRVKGACIWDYTYGTDILIPNGI